MRTKELGKADFGVSKSAITLRRDEGQTKQRSHSSLVPKAFVLLNCFVVNLLLSMALRAEEPPVSGEARIGQAIALALPLLERASAGSAEQRQCFTCHSQALPVMAIVEAAGKGFPIDQANLERQVEHTYAHLQRGRKNFQEGSGIGGGVDTAGYALWTLEAADRDPDDLTSIVVEYVLGKQRAKGEWKCGSDRPPSESSDFTTTYLALRSVAYFGSMKGDELDAALSRADRWLCDAQVEDNEDRVFRLLAANYVDVDAMRKSTWIDDLLSSQNADGGWSQTAGLPSDAYATATALYALDIAGVTTQSDAWQRGLQYLLQTQLEDGSWHVTTRSKPFQTYYETGFPHAEDQFISTAATGWATLALLAALPHTPTTEPE